MKAFLKTISFVILLIFILAYFTPFLYKGLVNHSYLDYAVFVGGVAGPLAAVLGFIYIYLTFESQQEQIKEQKERLDKEEASKEFAEYLNLWNEFRSKVVYTWNKQSGSKAFDSYWSKVKESVENDVKNDGMNSNDPKELTKSLKRHFLNSSFNKDSGQYDDFIRMIYPLLEIIEKGGLESRLKYLESLLSNGEKAILIYSATFIDQNQFAINLFKNGFCKNISDNCLVSPQHRSAIFNQ